MDSAEIIFYSILMFILAFVSYHLSGLSYIRNYSLDYLDECLENNWYAIYSGFSFVSPVCVYSGIKFYSKEEFEKYIYYDLKTKQK